MADGEVFVGLDLGTSGLKAVAVDEHGGVVAATRADYPTARPEKGASEQTPEHWMRAVRAAVAELTALVPAARWAGLGLSAMIPTLVPADDDGSACGPAITWEDARAEAHGDRLRDTVGADALYRTTGQWVDGRYLLPMALRLAALDQLPAGATRLLGAKDWLLAQLTGVTVTDPSTATGVGAYDLASGEWSVDVLDAVDALAGRALPRPPRVVPSSESFPLLAEIADLLGLPRGLPVAVGAADSVCGLLGLGVDAPGDAVVLAGTSTVILGVSDRLVLDDEHRFLVTPLAWGGYGLEMDLLATGSGLAWLADLLGIDGGATGVVALAREVDPADPDVPVFLPYVAPGEQGALWDPSLTGIVEGLTMRSTPAGLARGFANGVLVETRRCLGVLAETIPRLGDVHVAGQGGDTSALAEIADATGRTVHACGGDAPHSAVGAALIAATALGSTNALAAHGTTASAVRPDAERESIWDVVAAMHDRALGRSRA